MLFEHEFVVASPKKEAWAYLSDPNSIVNCIQGLQEYKVENEREVKARVKTGIGPLKGTFEVGCKIVERDDQEFRATLAIHGSGTGSVFDCEVFVNLRETSEGTLIHLRTDAKVGGLLAGIAQRLIKDVVENVLNQAFECVRRELSKQKSSGI